MKVDTVARWQDALTAKDACREAVEFARGFDSFQAAWDACERGDWMLWWIARNSKSKPMSPERRPLVRVACACARLALPHVKAGEQRPRLAIELAERWANGDDTVTRQEMRAAASAAAYAASAASAAASAVGAAAAAYAADAYAADAAADAAAASAAAYAAADAASAAAYAAADAAADARSKVLKECADLIRAEFPTPEGM